MCFQHNVVKQNLHGLDKKMQRFPNLTTEILPLVCKSITQVRGNESVPLEDMESIVRLD